MSPFTNTAQTKHGHSIGDIGAGTDGWELLCFSNWLQSSLTSKFLFGEFSPAGKILAHGPLYNSWLVKFWRKKKRQKSKKLEKSDAVSVDRTRDLQIFSLTLSQLSYSHLSSGGLGAHTNRNLLWAIFFTESGRPPHESWVMCMVLCLFVPGCASVRLTPTTMCIFERQIELASLIQYFAFSSHDSISNSKCISGKEKKTDPSIKCIGERDCIFDSSLLRRQNACSFASSVGRRIGNAQYSSEMHIYVCLLCWSQPKACILSTKLYKCFWKLCTFSYQSQTFGFNPYFIACHHTKKARSQAHITFSIQFWNAQAFSRFSGLELATFPL